jgi:hypothetical protein
MKFDNIEKDMKEMQIMLAKLQPTLDAINITTNELKEHMNKQCPSNRNEIYKKINNIDRATIRNTVIISIINTIIVVVLAGIVSGKIGG